LIDIATGQIEERAPNVGLWHKSEVPERINDVRSWG
jgi:hypothetical protein